MRPVSLFIVALLLATGLWVGYALAQDAASDAYRYRGYEESSGSYGQYEVLPFRDRRVLEAPSQRKGMLALGPAAAQVRVRTRLADSHLGLKFYTPYRNCVDCHAEQARTLHVVRNKITCRQCHGGEPIAGVEHYYSPLNSIRRHAYVCAKCHEGASLSFATYDIHEPMPASAKAKADFPALYWVFWIMAAIAVLTFAVFLPHTALWGLRELFSRKKKGGGS